MLLPSVAPEGTPQAMLLKKLAFGIFYNEFVGFLHAKNALFGLILAPLWSLMFSKPYFWQ